MGRTTSGAGVAIAAGAGGRAVLAGWADEDERQRLLVARVLADGTPDPAFGSDGRALFDSGSRWLAAVAVAMDGDRPVVAAAAEYPSGAVVARLTAAGAPDVSFGPQGMRELGVGMVSPTLQAISVDETRAARSSPAMQFVAGNLRPFMVPACSRPASSTRPSRVTAWSGSNHPLCGVRIRPITPPWSRCRPATGSSSTATRQGLSDSRTSSTQVHRRRHGGRRRSATTAIASWRSASSVRRPAAFEVEARTDPVLMAAHSDAASPAGLRLVRLTPTGEPDLGVQLGRRGRARGRRRHADGDTCATAKDHIVACPRCA